LINALSQIDTMQPAETIVEMQKPATQFGRALKLVLEQAGYGLRIVGDKKSDNLLRHAVSRVGEEPDGVLNSYQLVIGKIRLKRDYFEQPHGVTPSSNMYVIGTDPGQITLNDELFELASTQTASVDLPAPDPMPTPKSELPLPELQENSSVADIDTAPAVRAQPSLTEQVQEPQPETKSKRDAKPIFSQSQPKVDPPRIAPISVVPELAEDNQVAQTYVTRQVSARLVQPEVAPKENPAPLITVDENGNHVNVKGNMYDIGKSNFADFLANFTDVKSDILIFGNDSLRLGNKNKRFLDFFIDDFQSESDYISVIGCSHGRTALENGNAVLATGRAQRVKEALLYAGIPEDRVLEEGCWSTEPFDEKMPRRGVVVTHKRERRNS